MLILYKNDNRVADFNTYTELSDYINNHVVSTFGSAKRHTCTEWFIENLMNCGRADVISWGQYKRPGKRKVYEGYHIVETYYLKEN